MQRFLWVWPPVLGAWFALFIPANIAQQGPERAAAADVATAGADAGAVPISAVPLELAPAADSKTFVRLAAEATKIDFVHRWKPPEDDYDFRTLILGGGIAVGDYDGDSRPDVYLTRPDGGNRLYRNLGNFQFQDVTEQAGLDDPMWGMGATFFDIDNDGDLDLYACAFQSPNRLYINQGDGTFVERARDYGLDFNGASIMLAVADYDNDSRLDAYLVTNRQQPKDHEAFNRRAEEGFHVEAGRAYFEPDLQELMDVIIRPGGQVHTIMAGQYDRLYHNAGNGTFREVAAPSGIEGNDLGLAAVWWDYNQDGYADLYVANDFMGPDRLYRNNGNGTFVDVALDALPHTPWSSMGADVGDLNNDGRLDFMASDMSASSHYRDKVTMGDMSRMGWFLEWAEPRQYMRNAVYLNTGTERFMEVASQAGLAKTDWTWSVKCADLDGDGRVDVYASNGMTRDWENADLAAEVERRGGYHSEAGLQFWLDQPLNAQRNKAFRNQGDLTFEPVAEAWGLDHLGVTFGAALADLDGDGDLDLVTNDHDEPVGIYRNDVAAGHRVKIRLVGQQSNRWGIGATVALETNAGKQVRYLTVSRGFMSSDEPLVHFGLGAEETITKLAIQWPSGRTQQFENLPADQFYTIVEAAAGGPPEQQADPQPLFVRSDALREAVHRDEPFDDYARQPLLPQKQSQFGPGMAWGDLDGDGVDDLYLGGGAGYAGLVCRDLGSGVYRRSHSLFATGESDLDAESEDMGVVMFDVEGDGDLDVYVVSGGGEFSAGDAALRDRLYLNDGQGLLAKAPPAALPDVRDSGGVVCAADFDRDGDVDLFVGGRLVPGEYPVTPRSRLLRNESSTRGATPTVRLTDATDELAPELGETGLVTGAVWSDANNDGWLDLLVTHEWGPVKLFLNEEGTLVDRTAEAGLAERFGWYNGIAARDVDGDGDIDYAVANVGQNTKYHASQKKPTRLYYGDFEGNGRKHIVEAKVAGDLLLPVRGKSCSQNAMPFVRDKFPKYHDFASALLPDIYTPKCLDEALTLEATDFDSGVWINDGAARFTFAPLPRIAQIAPGYGIALTEVDGDGRPDLYLVQNAYSPQRETGHWDGGVSLLLRGRGDGTFEPVWPSASGLVVGDDGKSLALADVNHDGLPDFVVGVQRGPVAAFTHAGRGRGGLATVRWARPAAGGRSAIGARVRAILSDGSTQTAEVACGSGYLSQSSDLIAFGVPAGVELQNVEIRWPDGSESSHTGEDSEIQIKIVDLADP